MRIAAIDIGTNSLHMIVVRVRSDFSFEVIDREKEMVRLGAGGLGGRALTPEAQHSALEVLSKFRRLAESHRVDEVIAAATSATREAENGGDFLDTVAHQTGIRARVISGTEEARLIHLAAVYGAGVSHDPVVVVDIGGGSVEITRGIGENVERSRSFKLGVIRLTERFIRSDPLEGRDERRLLKHVNDELRTYLNEIRRAGFERVIGTSGTILSLGAVALAGGRRGSNLNALRNRRIAAKDIHRVRKHLSALTLDRRLRTPGLEPRRADLAVSGAIVLDTIVQRLGAVELTLCDLSLREGLILDYIARHRRQIAQADRYPDVRRRSVVELAERCNYWPEHANQVARLALALFDQTKAVHGLTDRERELAEYAALLHDVGVHISYERHHKHSYYLIKNGDLRGFEPDEIETIALVARYHRRAAPKVDHDGYAGLSRPRRRTVRSLAAILRLAESLDRSHAQTVSSLDLHDRGDDELLQIRTAGDAELEVWAAGRHAAPFEKLIGKPLRIEVSTQPGRVTAERAHRDGSGAPRAGSRPADAHAHVEQSDETARISGQALRGRRHRRIRQNNAARPPGKAADGRWPPRLRHGMELVSPRQGRDEGGEEEERADTDDVQPAPRDRFR
jgi:exopolyphosphatase/guanosine-5'-triphosphate,3'-diphosphate pyrophosphatase